jgi:abhydrolase domain-containing protein 17
MSEHSETPKESVKSEKPVKKRLLGALRRFVISGLSIYGLLVVFAWLGSELLIFQPHPSGYEDGPAILKLPLSNKDTISALYLANPKAKYTILYSHGNAEDLNDIHSTLQYLKRLGYSVFAYDYPGYGTSTGRPTEKGCYRAIEACYEHLTTTLKVSPEKLILMGRSVGGGPTMHLAATKGHKALILECTFTSTFRVAFPFPFIPFDRFPNKALIKNYKQPVLIMHGGADRVIPIHHGKDLFATCPSENKRSLFVDKAGHNNFRQKAGLKYRQALTDFPSLFD